MKKVLLIIVVLFTACLAWYGFTMATLPAPPVIRGFLSDEVDLNFAIHKMNLTEVELALAGGDEDVFVHFSMAGEWGKGRPGLKVNAMQHKSKFGNSGMNPTTYKKEHPGNSDFGQFMKDSKGAEVKQYTFRCQLAEGDDNTPYMKMSYVGPKMPLIQVLQFDKAMPVAPVLASRFGKDKEIRFLEGSYYLDRKINGFWIPITMTGK